MGKIISWGFSIKEIDRKSLVSSVQKSRKKVSAVEKYLQNLEKEIAALDNIVEVAKDSLPEQIEKAIHEVIKEEFKQNKFNAYIARDLFNAYVEAGGRKLLTKMLKQNPKQVMPLLKMIIDIGNAAEQKNNVNATQVNINIQGLDVDV